MSNGLEIAIGLAAVALSFLLSASVARQLRQKIRSGSIGLTWAVVSFTLMIFGMLVVATLCVTIVCAFISAYLAVAAGHENAFGVIPVHALRILAAGFIAAAFAVPSVAVWLFRSKPASVIPSR